MKSDPVQAELFPGESEFVAGDGRIVASGSL
jgi:hypothetical protein